MNIVFDFGAVLFRFEPLAVVTQVWPERVRGPGDDEALARLVFGGEWLLFDRGVLPDEDLVPRLAASTGLDVPRLAQLVDEVQRVLQPMPASVALLPRLRDRGHRLLYLSNMPRSFAQRLDPRNEVLPHFEAGLYSSEVGHVKPEVEIYREAEHRFGIAGARTVFVDDQPVNIAAALAFGWDAFRFEDAAQCERELAGRGCL